MTQGSSLRLLHCRQILYHLSHQRSHVRWSPLSSILGRPWARWGPQDGAGAEEILVDGWMDGWMVAADCSAEKTAGEDRKKTRGRERKRGRDRDSFWPVFPRRSALGNLPKDPALRASCWAQCPGSQRAGSLGSAQMHPNTEQPRVGRAPGSNWGVQAGAS